MDSATTHVVSLGEVARELATSCSRVVKAAADAGVNPVLVVDRVPHFAADDVERILEHLRDESAVGK